MDHQYRENGARNIYQMRASAYVEFSPSQSKNYIWSTFSSRNRRNFEDSGKVLAVSVSEFYQSSIIVQLHEPTLIRWLSLLYVYKWTTASVRLQLHGAIYRPDSFILMLRNCANLKAIRYESTSLNRIVADKSHRVIVA